MQLTVSRVVSPATAVPPGQRPAEFLSIHEGERWRAVTGPPPLAGTATAEWLTLCEGATVRIPLLPYLVPRDTAGAMAFSAQLGALVAHHAGSVRRLHLVIGQQLDDLLPEGRQQARYWLGIAVEG
jgi:hypothetical protein